MHRSKALALSDCGAAGRLPDLVMAYVFMAAGRLPDLVMAYIFMAAGRLPDLCEGAKVEGYCQVG